MPPRILAIDDSKKVRLMVGQALSAFACEVDEAANGFNALYVMERQVPDLILLDVNMPTMGGIELLTMLKKHLTLKKIPVIMLLSPTDHLVSQQLTDLGVNDRLMKPFTPEALLEKIRRILPLRSV